MGPKTENNLCRRSNIRIIQHQTTDSGLHLNISKCLWWFNDSLKSTWNTLVRLENVSLNAITTVEFSASQMSGVVKLRSVNRRCLKLLM